MKYKHIHIYADIQGDFNWKMMKSSFNSYSTRPDFYMSHFFNKGVTKLQNINHFEKDSTDT